LAREFLYVARNYGLCFLHGKLFGVVYEVWSFFALGVSRLDLWERHIPVDVSMGLCIYWCEDGNNQARPSMDIMMIGNMAKMRVLFQISDLHWRPRKHRCPHLDLSTQDSER